MFTAYKTVPIPTGDAEDYWEFACGVELESFDGYFPYANSTGIFPDKDGWYFYYYQEHHGRHVFKVSKQSLIKQTQEVFSLLDQEIMTSVQPQTVQDTLVIQNERRLDCLNIKKTVNSDHNRFVDTVSSNSQNQGYLKSKIARFNAQYEKSKLYWASILFEVIFLPLWCLFSFRPSTFGRLNNKASTRLAFAPLLLFLPYYLGYAPYLFSFGASGGILYPLFTMLLSTLFALIPLNQVDVILLQALPQPLSYISQVPYSPMAISFTGGVSPTMLCLFAASVLILAKIFRSIK